MKNMDQSNRGRFIVLNERDNVLICTHEGASGESVNIDGATVLLRQTIEVGHKIARTNLKSGAKIFKCGAAIGSLTENVLVGEHIHMHNLKSDYIASHTRSASEGNRNERI